MNLTKDHIGVRVVKASVDDWQEDYDLGPTEDERLERLIPEEYSRRGRSPGSIAREMFKDGVDLEFFDSGGWVDYDLQKGPFLQEIREELVKLVKDSG